LENADAAAEDLDGIAKDIQEDTIDPALHSNNACIRPNQCPVPPYRRACAAALLQIMRREAG
jgi:hypothetical protein